MLVKNWMRQPAVTIDADDVVASAAALLRKHEIRMLPVMRKGKLVGIIADRDIKIASASDVALENINEDKDFLSDIKINTIMSLDPVTVPYDYTLEETVEKFLVQNISGLPVVNEQQNVIGVITRSDLFHLILILTGFGKKGLQIALEVQDRPGCLKEITDIIRDYGGRIAVSFLPRNGLIKDIADYISVFLISISPVYSILKKSSKKKQLYYTLSIILVDSGNYLKSGKIPRMKVFKKILYPLFFAGESEDIVPICTCHGQAFNSQIHLLFAIGACESLSMIEPEKEIITEAKIRLSEFKKEYLKALPDTITSIACGNAWEEIMYYVHAKSIDLVIMGTHGRKAFDQIVFDSVAERVIKTAPAPVPVVNPYRVLNNNFVVDEKPEIAETANPKRLYH